MNVWVCCKSHWSWEYAFGTALCMFHRIFNSNLHISPINKLRWWRYFLIADPNSIFKIWTKAFTSRHEGQSSSPVLVETDVSSPDAPHIVNLTCQSDTTLYLQWRRPALFYGAVDLYYIYYRAEDAYQFEEIVINSIKNRVDHNVSNYYYYCHRHHYISHYYHYFLLIITLSSLLLSICAVFF